MNKDKHLTSKIDGELPSKLSIFHNFVDSLSELSDIL